MKYFTNVALIAVLVILNCGLKTKSCSAQTPDWDWAKSAGGTGNESGSSTVVDVAGNVYATGYFSSTTITFGSITLVSAGSSDVFIVKYDPLGNVLWAKNVGGIDGDIAFHIAIDNSSGYIYVTGWFGSSTITFGTVTLTNTGTAGTCDIFLAKYDSSGNVIWAKSAAGAEADVLTGACVDNSGNVCITGWFVGSTITFGTVALTNSGSAGTGDIFIVKYDPSGNVLWAKKSGGTTMDGGYGIVADAGGNLYVTGLFSSPTITFGTTTLTNAGAGTNDLFITKYDLSGNVLWAKRAGGTDSEVGYVAVVYATDVYVTGEFGSSAITFDGTTLTNGGPVGTGDVFLVKLDGSGNTLWAKNAGGAYRDFGFNATVDVAGNVYVTGGYSSATITFGTTTLTNAVGGYLDVFLVKYDGLGNALWGKTSGGAYDDMGFGVAVDASENIYVTGRFNSAVISFNTSLLFKGCGDDFFLAKLLSTTIGVAENNSADVINIYPNPSSGRFTLLFNSSKSSMDSKNTDVSVFNMHGETVSQCQISNLASPIDVDLSDRSKGIYFVQIQSGEITYQSKIIVE